MLKKRLLIVFLFGFIQVAASYDLSNNTTPKSAESPEYIKTQLVDQIIIEATDQPYNNIRRWLLEIASIPKGYDTLKAIVESGHSLTIKHSYAALLSAGRTVAPMTNDLINGVGADVTIIFDGNIPEQGSHRVFDGANKPIEFTAVQNLYHELAHAMHQMQGTWRYFASEKQAIEEENIFRYQEAMLKGVKPTQRFRKSGVLINRLGNGQLGYKLPDQ